MNSHPPIRILIDDRERNSAAAEVLMGMPGIRAEFARLKVGDYRVDERLLVERKTMLDLALSIQDGRLFRQATALANTGEPSLLILEGRGSALAGCRMPREAVQGALITVSMILGIPVLRAMDGEETARLVLYAAQQIRRNIHGAVHRPGRRPRGKRGLQLHLLQGLPSIGPGRAECLLERFGSVGGVLSATEAELRSVDGIGKTTARKIHWAVRESTIPYKADPHIMHGRPRLAW